MTMYGAPGTRGDLVAVAITTGQQIPVISDPTSTGCLLLGGITYYFPFGSDRSALPRETVDIALHMRWALAVAGTATIEACNFPQTLSGSGQGGADVTDWDSTLGNWVQIDPTLAGPVYANALGSGNSIAKYTVTLGGTAAGAAIWNIPDFGFHRGRIKLVVTTGGIVRASISGKLGA